MLCVSELLWRAELPGRAARAVQVHQQVLRPGAFATYSTAELRQDIITQRCDNVHSRVEKCITI